MGKHFPSSSASVYLYTSCLLSKSTVGCMYIQPDPGLYMYNCISRTVHVYPGLYMYISRTVHVYIQDCTKCTCIYPGRCVTEDFGHLSCVDDVLFEVASSCSGRHACEVRVDDKVFRRAKPCHKDLKNHLWVSYHCTNGQCFIDFLTSLSYKLFC